MIEGLKQDRAQFELILALREPLRDHSEELVGAYPCCRGLGLGPDHTWRMLYIARGQKLNRVLRHSTGQAHDLNLEESYWIFPYFANHHTSALLEIENSNGRPVQTARIPPRPPSARRSIAPPRRIPWLHRHQDNHPQ